MNEEKPKMKIFKKSEYDLLIEYNKNYIAVIKNQPYRPSLGDRLELDDCGGDGPDWFEIVSFPTNMFPIGKTLSELGAGNQRWLVEVKKSTPYSREQKCTEVKVYK